MSNLPKGAIVVPPFCDFHQRDLIRHRLKITETGLWRVATVIANVLCFTWATTEKSVNDRLGAEGEPQDLGIILGEYGCLACSFGEGFDRATILIRRDMDHAAQVSQGKATDPDWPIAARVAALQAGR